MTNTSATNEGTALTVHQVADRLNVSARTIWAWIARGRLRAIKLGPRTTRIPEQAVEDFLRACAAADG